MSSRADTIVSPVVRSPRSWASHRGPGSCRFRSPDPEWRWRRRGLPSSWGTLVVIVRALRPRQDQTRSVGPGVARLTRSPPMSTTKTPSIFSFRGSMTRPLTWLSTLRRVSCLTTTQDSLLAAGPALPGGIGYPQGPTKGFRVRGSSSFPQAFLAQGHC